MEDDDAADDGGGDVVCPALAMKRLWIDGQLVLGGPWWCAKGRRLQERRLLRFLARGRAARCHWSWCLVGCGLVGGRVSDSMK